MKNFDSLTELEISKRLQRQVSPTYDVPLSSLEGDCRDAAVLLPLLRFEDAWHLLFIRRSISEHDPHSGQVAFAGGKAEQCDASLQATALRETHEEIGIKRESVSVLGQLSPHYSISRFQITPVVGSIPWPYDIKPDPSEVSHTFTLPLNWLADESNHEIRYRQLSQMLEPVPVVYFKEYAGELLWGATARMTISLIKTLNLESSVNRYDEGQPPEI